jgi:hypothetical protein
VALINTGENNDGPNTYSIQIFDGATGKLATSVTSITVKAKQWIQIGSILAQYAPGVQQGYVRLLLTSGNNPTLFYGVINDGGQPGQRSGDGAFVESSY